MASRHERSVQRLAEIRKREAQLDHEAADRAAAGIDAAAAVVDSRKSNLLRSAVFLIVIVGSAVGLLGLAITCFRLAGQDIDDATRLGQAEVTSCQPHGPITTRGFGYWDRCTATITWDGGVVERRTVEAVFHSGDIGTPVKIGETGVYRQDVKLARADTAHRPWLAWIGYPILVVALVPTLISVLILREVFRFRRR